MKITAKLTVIVAPLLMAGCSDSDSPSDWSGAAMNIDFAFVDYDGKWRDVTFGDFADGAELGLTLSTSGISKSDLDYLSYNADNQRVVRVGVVWSTGARLLWKGNKNQVSYTAYMPYHEDPQALEAWRVSSEQTAASVIAEDLLIATGTTTAETAAAEGLRIELGHALAEFDVSLNITDDIYRTASVSKVMVGACRLSYPATATAVGETTTLVKIPDTETHYGLVPPQTVTDLKVSICMSDGTVREYVATDATEFVANRVNHLILNVTRDKIEKGIAVVDPWKDGNAAQ